MTEGVLVEVDLTGIVQGLTEETGEETGVLKGVKCIQQYAINAARNVKFLLSRKKAGLCIAKIAIRRREDIRVNIILF